MEEIQGNANLPTSNALDNAVVQFGNQIRAIIGFNGGQIISISKNQKEFLKWFFNTGNFNLACEKAGIAKSTAANWFRNKNFKTFVKERIEYSSKAIGYDILKWQSRLVDIFEGREVVNNSAIKAGEVLGKSKGFFKEELPPPPVVKTEIKDSNVELVFKFEKEPGSLNSPNPAFFPNPGSGNKSILPLPDLNGRQAVGEV